MEENKKQDEVNYINFEDADNFEINSEDIFINKPNENPNNKDNSVKNEETNTTELKEDSKLEEVDPSKKICPHCKMNVIMKICSVINAVISLMYQNPNLVIFALNVEMNTP